LKAFALALALGIASASLLFLRAQSAAAAQGISEDLKLILFLREAPSDADRAAMESRLRALDGIEAVAFVTPQESLARLTRADAELVRGLALVGPSPLPAAFEMRLGESGIESAPALLSKLADLSRSWGVVRYPSQELSALIETKFYAQTLRLVLELLGWLAVFVIAARIAAHIPAELYQRLFGLPRTSDSHVSALKRYLGAARGALALQVPTAAGALAGAILGVASAGIAFLPAAALLPAGDVWGYGVGAGGVALLCAMASWALIDAPSL
jgi:hypothetical protein